MTDEFSIAPRVFNRISTGVRAIGGRFYLWVRYDNTDTGESKFEVSERWFYTESEADQAAIVLAQQLRDKIA